MAYLRSKLRKAALARGDDDPFRILLGAEADRWDPLLAPKARTRSDIPRSSPGQDPWRAVVAVLINISRSTKRSRFLCIHPNLPKDTFSRVCKALFARSLLHPWKGVDC